MEEPEAKSVAVPPSRTGIAPRSPVASTLLSTLVPGLGQIAQRRVGAALAQFLTVATYLVAVWGTGNPRAAILAIAWNLWSAIDAYRHDRD